MALTGDGEGRMRNDPPVISFPSSQQPIRSQRMTKWPMRGGQVPQHLSPPRLLIILNWLLRQDSEGGEILSTSKNTSPEIWLMDLKWMKRRGVVSWKTFFKPYLKNRWGYLKRNIQWAVRWSGWQTGPLSITIWNNSCSIILQSGADGWRWRFWTVLYAN